MRIGDLLNNCDFNVNASFIIRARECNTDEIHDVYCSWKARDDISYRIASRDADYMTIERGANNGVYLVIEYPYWEEEGWE